mgnify:CR=1 FL=1
MPKQNIRVRVIGIYEDTWTPEEIDEFLNSSPNKKTFEQCFKAYFNSEWFNTKEGQVIFTFDKV